MALTSATNFTGGNAFEWGTADTDAYDRAHTQAPAAALDVHTHASGLGLPVTRLGTVTSVTGISAAVAITVAGLALTATNTNDGASSQVAILQGDRATMAANDEAYLSLRLSDSAGNQDEFARITWVGTTVTSTSEAGQLRFGIVVAGSLTDTLRLSGTVLSPSANDGVALGSTTLGFADVHLATGGVINWANGEVTITETDAGTLTIAGASTLIDVAAGIVELNNALRFDTGVAMVAASYSVGRDADATNQLHLNVPTGATFEWSVNDTVEMTLSATDLNLQSNTLSNIGAAGTDFSATGGLTLADILTVSAGGIIVTGNSTITGTLGGLTGLTVASGIAYINDTANASMTTGLTINQGAADDEILAFKSSDIAHGVTTICETDTYGRFLKQAADGGGLRIDGLSDTNAYAMQFRAIAVGEDTTRATTSLGTIVVDAMKANVTNVASLAANGNLVVIRDNSTTRAIIDVEGDLHLDATYNQNVWDEYDDLALLSAYRAITAHPTNYRRRFGEEVSQHAQVLHDTGVITLNADGHHFVSVKGMFGLTIDAIRQLGLRLEERTRQLTTALSRLDLLETRPALLRGGAA